MVFGMIPGAAFLLKPIACPALQLWSLTTTSLELKIKIFSSLSTNNELQGTNSSGSLGGLDVRRRIPIKLISKQGNKAKASPRTPRTINRMPAKAPAGDEGFDYNEEERYDCKGGELFGNQRRFPGHLFWDFQINILGEKDDTPVHFCDKCGLPIKIYGRMIPCKHVFCYDCAILHEKKGDKMCPGSSLVAQTVKHLPTTRETQVQSLGPEDLLEKEMATHSSILAWQIPWMEEPGIKGFLGKQAGRN